MKKIDLNKNLFELTEEFPELINILKDLGFLGVINPVLRNTLGRTMTIPQGCVKQGKDLNEVISALKRNGFEIIGG